MAATTARLLNGIGFTTTEHFDSKKLRCCEGADRFSTCCDCPSCQDPCCSNSVTTGGLRLSAHARITEDLLAKMNLALQGYTWIRELPKSRRHGCVIPDLLSSAQWGAGAGASGSSLEDLESDEEDEDAPPDSDLDVLQRGSVPETSGIVSWLS